MNNYDLQSKYCEVLINEVLDTNSFSIENIIEWYNACKQYMIGNWFDDLHIPSNIDTDSEFEKINSIIENSLRDQTYHMFKNMYEGDVMLGMLKDYIYTPNDSHIIDLINADLYQTCDWLIELCIYCIKYHLLRILDEDVQDVIAEYGLDYSEKILQTALIKLKKIDTLDLTLCSQYLTGYDKVIFDFIKAYKFGKIEKMSLSQKLVLINQFKNVAHYNGTLIQGSDPLYIFDREHKNMYDSITQLNHKMIERKLKRIAGY